jgi:hypothetical protein
LRAAVATLLLVATATPSFAAGYFIVVPVPAKTTAAKNINVSLAGYTLPSGLQGQPYVGFDFKKLLSVTGDAQYTGYGVHWSVVGGSLPAGLTLNSDGTLSGTPSASGTSGFRVMATYKTKAGEQDYQVVVGSITVALATGAPPQAIVGQAYAYNLNQLVTVSGDPSYTGAGAGVTWNVVSNSLPAGLYLTSDGWIAGTPTAGGTGAITARATYRGVNGQQSYQVVSLNISVALAAGTPPQAIVGQTYAYNLNQLVTVNGDPSYTGAGLTWNVLSNSLPAGLYLTSDGWIAGTPTAGGTGAITARATYRGVNGQQTYQVVSLNISVALAGATPPQGMVSQAYSYDLKPLLSVSGDSAYDGSGVTWSVTSGTLPAGLSLGANGVISGTPSASTTATFEITATYRARSGAQSYQLFIAKLPGNGTLSVTSLDFGTQAVGSTTAAQSVSLTNTGGDTLTVSGLASTGPFAVTNGCPASLAPNQSCVSNVTFKPTAMGAVTGAVTVSTSSGDRTVNLTGTGLATLLTPSPSSISFGGVNVNSSSSQTFTLKNAGNTATTSLKYAVPAGVTEADNCGQALGAGASCTVTLTWSPTVASTLSSSVTVNSQDSQATVALAGNGLLARLTASPTSLAFGTQKTGTTVTQSFTLTNAGNTTATSLAISVPAGYTQSSNCGNALAANASCTVQVSFAPPAAAAYNGTVSVTSSAATVGVGVTGTGGVATFALSTGSITMPMANVGSSTSSSFTITNTGSVAGTPSISSTANFSATQCGSIPAGGNCVSTVYFTPNTSQTASQGYGGTVSVSGSSAGTQSISLGGTGASSTAQAGTYVAGSVPVYSLSQQYALVMQGDCNLVLYNGAYVPSNAVWASGTAGKSSGCYLGVQTDGNLVVYGQGNAVIWQSSTGGHSAQPSFIQLDNSGILHMYLGTPSAPGALLWSSR